MKAWLYLSLGFILTLAISGCSPVDPALSSASIILKPTDISSADISYERDLRSIEVDKPLPELDQIEALLREYSGTDVN